MIDGYKAVKILGDFFRDTSFGDPFGSTTEAKINAIIHPVWPRLISNTPIYMRTTLSVLVLSG